MLLCKKEKVPEVVKIIEIVGDEVALKVVMKMFWFMCKYFFSFECDYLDEDNMENLGIAGKNVQYCIVKDGVEGQVRDNRG